MPVQIEAVDDTDRKPRRVDVTHICERCGREIRTFRAFEDSVDTDLRPVHESVLCHHEGRKPDDTSDAEAVLRDALGEDAEL